MIKVPDNKIEMEFHFEQGEVININKPSGWTSFDVVKKIRNLARVKKVGHAGTLDPFATGVLVVCTGKATKKINEFVDASKEYVGEVFLGAETDSYDVTGKIVAENKTVPAPNHEQVEKALDGFCGEILQIPPMFSALKVNGKRLYKYAREGKEIDRKARKVTVHSLQILNYDFPLLQLKISCSKGTYIRSIAYDLGRVLGTGGYLQSLIRTRVGEFSVNEAWQLDDFVAHVEEAAPWK